MMRNKSVLKKTKDQLTAVLVMSFFMLALVVFHEDSFARSEVTCWDDNCLKNGWYRIDQNSQNLIHNVVCRSADSVSLETDCMKFGWVIYSSQGQEAVISCFSQDCRQKGWLIQTSYELIRVNCKAGGCWQKGWIEN